MSRPADGTAHFLKQRLQSLDAYRGLIMITLAFESFGLAATAHQHLQNEPSSGFWKVVQHQFSHVEWAGCAYTDLIQPSFMFMVGVSMAYSYLKRRQMGHSYGRMFGHALWRSLVLVFLGVFLMSNWDPTTNWTFVNVLTQIGLGYAFLFLLWGRTFRTQAIAAAGVLVGTWLLFVLYPGSGVDLATGAPDVGVTAAWAQEHLAGIHAPWHKNANVGHAIDLWLLNLLPRPQPFRFNEGGYPTINFLPSLATMLFGLMCGELLRSDRSPKEKLTKLALAGVGGLVLGQVLHWTGICPAVKRIWTPGWAIFSTGWCCLILAALYGLIDVLNCRRWAFPLVVVGLNSVAMYCMGMTLKPWVAQSLKTHLGPSLFSLGGETYEPMVHATLVGLVLWLICWWMYRRRIFLRI
jgi:heparan-alpha-glucosaminide N-acetyltransferase